MYLDKKEINEDSILMVEADIRKEEIEGEMYWIIPSVMNYNDEV